MARGGGGVIKRSLRFHWPRAHRVTARAEPQALENLVTDRSQKFWLSRDCPYVRPYAKSHILKNKRVAPLPQVHH